MSGSQRFHFTASLQVLVHHLRVHEPNSLYFVNMLLIFHVFSLDKGTDLHAQTGLEGDKLALNSKAFTGWVTLGQTG